MMKPFFSYLVPAFLLLSATPRLTKAAQPVGGAVLRQSLKSLGTQSLAGAASRADANSSPSTNLGTETRNEPEQDRNFDKLVRGSISQARVPAAHVPAPSSSAVASGGALGFDGLTHLDQRLADNGNQFSLEPPDQGFAVGNGYVVEAVNLAVRVRSTTGGSLTAPIALNRFFNLPSTIARNSSPIVYGPFLSDPKIYYDGGTGRFFLTVLEIDTAPATGALLGHSSVLLAVSQTNVPTGSWYLYKLDTTDDGTGGTASHPGCPCFGDQPLIGADANGFYISTNEFPIAGDGFNGAQLYALSKTALAAGSLPPVAAIAVGNLAEGLSYSLQPATTPPGAPYELANGGTEYFMSALDFNSTLDNRIALWSLRGTGTLNSTSPSVSLQYAILDSQVYGQPPAMQQKDGPLPLADQIRAGAFGKPASEHLPLLDSNDDRMQQAVFSAGKLWCSLTTVIKPENGPVRAGIAWFVVAPGATSGQLTGTISNQGYVAVNRNNVAYPAIAVNPAGRGLIGFTLVGPDYYPSAAYILVDGSGTSGDVFIAKAGAAPDDGFTGYLTTGGSRVGRWGDYSAASADETGQVWFATEYIPDSPRTLLANWGTFIAQVQP